mgnify:CR=1 FL=1
MYPEFLVIYIGLGVVILLLAAGLAYLLGKMNREREKLLRLLLKLKPTA